MKMPSQLRLDLLDATILFVIGIVGLVVLLSYFGPPVSSKGPNLQAGTIQQIFRTGGARYVRLTASVTADHSGETIYVEEPISGFSGCKVGDHLYLRRDPTLRSGYQFIPGSCLSS